MAKSFEFSQGKDNEDVQDGSIVYLEHTSDPNAEFDSYSVLVESLRADLSQFKASSSVIYEGKEYKRDPLTVLELMMSGVEVKEIAEILDTSKQFVYLLIKKIRNCDTLKDYKPVKVR